MHSYSSPGAGHSENDPAADEQENQPNGNRTAQQHSTKRCAVAASDDPPLFSPSPLMSQEEDSGRGESRNEFPERGSEAAYDDPSREPPPGLAPPLTRPHSLTSHSSAADSTTASSSSSPSEFDPSKVYVENLPLPISETQLRDLFEQFGAITRIHIGTDRLTKAQLGFGFVEFAQDQQGLNAIAAMHQREFNGRTIRCSQARRRVTPNSAPAVPFVRQKPLLGESAPSQSATSAVHAMQQPQHPFMLLSGLMQPQQMGGMMPGAGMMVQTPMGPMIMMMPSATTAPSAPAAAAPAQPAYGRNDAPPSPNIFINGIPYAYTESDLQSLFEAFGTILSAKILLDPQGKSKGQGFVHFDKQISAQASIQAWNGKKPPNGETYLQVRYALPRKPAVGAVLADSQQQSAAAAVQPGVTLQFAASHGASGATDASSGYGPDRKARSHIGQKYDPLVRSAQPPASTVAANLTAAAQSTPAVTASPNLIANGPDSTTLFIYHVPKNLTNDELQALFSQHGGVVSVSIPRGANNENKGFAFAKMQTMADAHNAMNALQGHEIQGKRLKVSFKTERRADPGVVHPPGSVANTALIIAQSQQQAQQPQPQIMMMNPMMGGMMYNPMMMGGAAAMMPQQQQMQMMQQQQMMQMGQMQPGAGGAMHAQPGMQMGMMQPMMGGGYGMPGMMHPGNGGGQSGYPGGAVPPPGPMSGYGGMQPMYQQPQQQPYPQPPYPQQ